VSIGALSRNRFWNETEPKRGAHATTTVVRDGKTTILVDPGLPEQLLVPRLEERTGVAPDQIDAVFLTNFRPVHRRALGAFSKASWLMAEAEIEACREHLSQLAASAREGAGSRGGRGVQERELEAIIKQERGMLDRIAKVPDKLTKRVHLFPCPGVTPGASGLLLTEASRSVVVCGDAVISRDYYEAGQVYEQVYDLEAAQASFRDIMEVADLVIPGHDNVFLVTGR
jgi:glyoxylase-like metal-dependent hydrolase (beta-lactamase superfamily II)